MVVDRCVCAEVTFEEMLRLHREEGLELEQIRERTGIGRGCSSCSPYLRLTLRTGRARHPVLSRREMAAAIRGTRGGTRGGKVER